MAKRRGWYCNPCGDLLAKVGKGVDAAIVEHRKTCAGDSRGLITVSLKEIGDGRMPTHGRP